MTSNTISLAPSPQSAPARGRSLSIQGAARTLRLLLRNAYATLLNTIPDAWLLPIRGAYIAAAEGSLRRRVLFALLKGIRYKHPDLRQDSFALPDQPSVRLVNVNSIIVRHLYWFGVCGYEGTEVRAWEYFCARARHVLEIGANIGFYTICGAQKAPDARYTAVEAHPHTAAILRRNLALNGVGGVNVIEAAVVGHKTADHTTLVVPVADQDETPSGSFIASGGEVSRAAATTFDVPVVAARDLLRGVDLLKLDVEGYEFDILSAVRDELERGRPTIFVEILPEAKKLHRFVGELARSGAYRILVCGGKVREVPPEHVESGQLFALYGTRDVVLITAERMARFAASSESLRTVTPCDSRPNNRR